MIHVTVKGSLRQQVEKAMEARRVELEKAVGEAAEAIKNTAKRLVPVSDDAPHIRDNIEVNHEGLSAQVGVFENKYFYGQFIEFGTLSRPARPFLNPAAEQERKQFTDRIREALK